MWTHVNRGEEGRKPDFFVDIINGWPLSSFMLNINNKKYK